MTVQGIIGHEFGAEAVSSKFAALAAWEPSREHLEAFLGMDVAQPLWDSCQLLNRCMQRHVAKWVLDSEIFTNAHTSNVSQWPERFTVSSDTTGFGDVNSILMPALFKLFDFEKARWSATVLP